MTNGSWDSCGGLEACKSFQYYTSTSSLTYQSVCIASIFRMTTLKTSSQTSDRSRGTLYATIWTVVEANVGIVCACLPTLRAPLQKYLPKIFGRGSRNEQVSDGSQDALALDQRVTFSGMFDQRGKPIRTISHKMSASSIEAPILGRSSQGTSDIEKGLGDDRRGSSTEDVPLGEIRKKTDVDVRSTPWEPVDFHRTDSNIVQPQSSFP